MGDIVPFRGKQEQEDGSHYYLFYYNKDSYAMVINDNSHVIAYGSATIDGDQLIIREVEQEFAEMLFAKTYDWFFVDVEEDGEEELVKCALLVYFEFEGEEYATYYEEDDEVYPSFFFRMSKEEGPIPIFDELKLRRIEKWFFDTYVIV